MAFLDFIKNKQAAQQQAVAKESQAPKPDTAKEMYSREATQEQTKATALDRLPDAQKAKVVELGARLERATRHQSAAASSSPTPEGASGSPEAMRQKMQGQDKDTPELSPTSMQSGTPAHEKAGPSPEQSKTPDRAKTLPRTPPSWER